MYFLMSLEMVIEKTESLENNFVGLAGSTGAGASCAAPRTAIAAHAARKNAPAARLDQFDTVHPVARRALDVRE
jgi:hypothetical protein